MNSAQLSVPTGQVTRLKLPDPDTFEFSTLEDRYDDPHLREKEDHTLFDWPGAWYKLTSPKELGNMGASSSAKAPVPLKLGTNQV